MNTQILYLDGIGYIKIFDLLNYLSINGNKTDIESFIKQLQPKVLEDGNVTQKYARK